MKVLLVVILAVGFKTAEAQNNFYEKVFQCVAQTESFLEYKFGDHANSWIPYDYDLIATASTRVGAMAQLKNDCIKTLAKKNFTIRIVGTSDEAINPYAPYGFLKLEAHNKAICKKILTDHTVCEAGERHID